jgi:hypothetical protein
MLKICSKCKLENECRKGRSQCKLCDKKYREANKDRFKRWREDNKQSISEKNKQYYKENKEAIKQYQQDNREVILKRKKQYNLATKETRRQYNQFNKEARKKYYLANYKYVQNKIKTDPIFKFKKMVRSLISNSFKRSTNKFKKSSKTEQILGCTIEQFRDYIQSKFKKGMSFDNHGQWHLDHIIPLSSALTKEEIVNLNYYTNFQPLWAHENLSKSDKIIETQLILC